MATYWQVIKVFIGSPSDVNEEREYFLDAVAQVNKATANIMGVHMHPLRWEDTLPGKARPQDMINDEYIRDCDLAVFVLWKRWGSPTPIYSSGFEEEFELANSLFDKNNRRPEIFLYLRHIPDESATNHDEQFVKVRNFRNRIKSECKFRYDEYENPEEWKEKFKLDLNRWIIRKFAQWPEVPQRKAKKKKKTVETKPQPVQVSPVKPQWDLVNTPGCKQTPIKEILNPHNQGSGINKICVANDGMTLWAITRCGDHNGINKGGAQVVLLRSTDGGISWTDTEYLKLATAQSHIENGTFIWDLSIAPDDPNIVVVACADISVNPLIQEVWISTDKGDTWANTGWPPPNITAGYDFISSMDISKYFGNRIILIGTRDGSGLDTNNIQITRIDQLDHWTVQDASNTSKLNKDFTGDVLAAKFSPNFPSDHTIVLVYCDGSSTHKGTWLITGTYDIKQNFTLWQKHSDHVEIRNADNKLGDSPRVDELIIASLELPSDFYGKDNAHRRFYVSTDAIDRIPGLLPNRGVYRIDNRAIYTLMDNTHSFGVVDTNSITRRVASIAYFGTCISGKLLVGEVLGYGNLATVPTWFTDSPHIYPIPYWYPALKPTTGAAGQAPSHNVGYISGYGNAKIVWSPDGRLAYAATGAASLGPWAAPVVADGAINIVTAWPAGYVNVIPFDEAAFGVSRNNGETWNQLSLINTLISKFTDVAPSPDGKTIYLASVNTNVGSQGFDSVWRSSSNPDVTTPLRQPQGTYWERILTHVTAPDFAFKQTDMALLRIVPYCADPRGEIIAWGVWDPLSTFPNGIAAWSPDYGDYWAFITPRNPIQDFTFESQTVLYFLSPTGSVQKMPYTGTGWSAVLPDVDTKLQGAHTIASYPEGKVLVGADLSHHRQLYGASFSNNFNTDDPSFSVMSAAGKTPFMGNMHVAFDPNFWDNHTIFACDNSITGGSVYRNNPISQVRWEDGNIMGSINGAVGSNAPHRVGQYGLVLAFTGGALYSAHELIPKSTPPGNSGVCRTFKNGVDKFGPLSGIPQPGVTWDCFDRFGGHITAGVTFSTEPTSLKACGCCTLDTDTMICAIDCRPYVPTSKIGMLWVYTDHTAKRHP